MARFAFDSSGGGGLLHSVKTVLLVDGSILALSPVLRLLTDAFSDDTIWALSSALLALHVACFNYAGGGSGSPLALNAAVFASVLLGSRCVVLPPRLVFCFSLSAVVLERRRCLPDLAQLNTAKIFIFFFQIFFLSLYALLLLTCFAV